MVKAEKGKKRFSDKPMHTATPTRKKADGFTLIELVIVMAIIATLTAIAVPMFSKSVNRAKEAALREDLMTMRQAIDSYTVDKEKAPQSLEDLVLAGYLKSIPNDPMTSRNDTWIVDQGGDLSNAYETQGGIGNVHSGSQASASDGTIINTW